MDNEEFRLELESALKIEQAMKVAGWPNEYAMRLADPDFLKILGYVFSGQREIVEVALEINLDCDPYLPRDWRRLKHALLDDKWVWDPNQLELAVTDRQVRGDKLIKSFKNRRLMNARCLDHLWWHPVRLPSSWLAWLQGNNQRTICFAGTKYSDNEAHECVRCLILNREGKLIWSRRRLKDYWGENDAIVLMIP